jgi:hypothetical protein
MKPTDWLMKRITLKNIWWVILVGAGSYFMFKRFCPFKSGTATPFDFIIFLVWICLLLMPFFQEIDIFGVKLRKEINSLKGELKEQIINLRSEMLSISIKNQVSQETNFNVNWNVAPESENIGLKKILEEIHKEVTKTKEIVPEEKKTVDLEVQGAEITFKGEAAPVTEIIKEEELELSEDALRVLSTLWIHQQKYSPKIWMFTVGSLNPNYPSFALGVGQGIRHGLIAVYPQNGQVYLAESGINYCNSHREKIKPDWSYERWKNPT